MPLSAQRLRDNPTLVRCVDAGYRMMAGESDRDAVKRLQLALLDLGYVKIDRIDGIWAGLTDDAVIEFKVQERFDYHDAVASTGTIGQLDNYFSWEPADPDFPDPFTDGLEELIASLIEDIAERIDRALGVINVIAWGAPADATDAAWRSALLTHCGIDAGDGGVELPLARRRLERRLNGIRQVLVSGRIIVLTGDRAAWHASTGLSFYSADKYSLSDEILTATPAFRNALPYHDQLATLIRIGARTFDATMRALGYPGTARYGWLSPEEREMNNVGLAALILFLSEGESASLHPPPIWGDLSSFPGP